MQKIGLLLGISGWAYGRRHDLVWETGKYENHRTITLQCFHCGELQINGDRFLGPISVHIRIEDPISLPRPLDLDFIGTHYAIWSVLGGVKHSPKQVDGESGDELRGLLEINLLVSQDIFAELLEARHELKTLHLNVIGERVNIDLEGEPSWDYRSNEENVLYIIGFDYRVASPCQDAKGVST